jgi:hypothetical protein
MALKKFKDVGNTGFVKGWEDTVKDKFLQFKPGESKEVRFIDAFMETLYHWVPFMSKKKGKMSMFPQQCLRHSVHVKGEEDPWTNDAECPACDLGLQTQAHAIFPVIDVEALFNGDQNSLKFINLGPRERQKIEQLRKFNKVHGEPMLVGDSQYGKIVQIVNDPNNKDPALRWQFNTGQRLRIRYNEETGVVRVTIPDNVESDHKGETIKFTVPDIAAWVTYPTAHELLGKYERMHVADAMEIYEENQKKYRKEKGDDDEDDDRSKRKRRDEDDEDSPRSKGRKDHPRDEDDDDDEPPKRKKRSPDEDDDDEPPKRKKRYRDDDDDDESPKRSLDDEDDDSGTDDDEPPKKKRSRDEDDSEDDEPPKRKKRSRDEDDEPPRRRRTSSDDDDESPKKRRPKDDDSEDDGDSEDDDDDKPSPSKKREKKSCVKNDKGNKCPLHKRCYGMKGDAGTEDCTICPHKKACHTKTHIGDDDDE